MDINKIKQELIDLDPQGDWETFEGTKEQVARAKEVVSDIAYDLEEHMLYPQAKPIWKLLYALMNID